MRAQLLFCVGLIWLGFVAGSNVRASAPYHFLKEIPIDGDGGWDYVSCDPAAHRLYVAHATKIVVIDTERDAVIGEIDDTPGVHGFAIASDLGLGFSSNGKESRVSVVDLKSLKTRTKIPVGEGPDSILYAAKQHEIYTFNGEAKTASVIDAKTLKVIATIPLPGDPESPAYDPTTGMVYDCMADKNEVVVIDPKTHQVKMVWPLPATGEFNISAVGQPTGMAINPKNGRLFVGCRGSNQLVMLDLARGKILATVPIHDGNDACAFDPATGFTFASTREGELTIAHEDASGKLVIVQDLTTEIGARTLALDLATHRVYLPTAKFEPLPDSAPAHPRPKMIPGSMKILVYGM